MSYQHERDQFIARMAAEGLPFHVTMALLRAATTLNRYAELACSSEAADRDRVPCPAIKTHDVDDCVCDWYVPDDTADPEHQDVPRIAVQEDRLIRRLKQAMPADWAIVTQGDPRGYVLRVVPPSYTERNAGRDVHNIDAIGVPSRESGIKW